MSSITDLYEALISATAQGFRVDYILVTEKLHRQLQKEFDALSAVQALYYTPVLALGGVPLLEYKGHKTLNSEANYMLVGNMGEGWID